MRNEKEMFSLILNIANNDKRIRAVYMNGSRANQNIKKIFFKIMILYMWLQKLNHL